MVTGRAGAAITFDDRTAQRRFLLIFQPETGELLADEELELKPARIGSYRLFLATARTDHIG